MLIKEVESKISDFADVQVLSSKDIIRRRVAELINKDYRKEIFLDKKNVLRQKSRICANPRCRSTNIKHNGFHKSGSFVLKEIGMEVKVGQNECKDCGFRWSIDVSELYQALERLKEQTREFPTQIRVEKNSLQKTSSLIKAVIGRK